jgi:hypothetical protein
MAYRTVRIGFRFLALTEQALVELREFQDAVMSRSSLTNPGFVTGGFDLNEEKSYDWIGPFVAKHGIDESDYGLFVSLRTDSDSDMVTIPDFALNLSREIGGEIAFSFTVLSDE